MRFLLGCIGVAFVVFGGCVLAIFGSAGVAPDELVFAIGALLLLLSGIWAIYKAVMMHRALRAGDQDQPGTGPP
jgi:hypothetical protein